jgi:hypothetical protein
LIIVLSCDEAENLTITEGNLEASLFVNNEIQPMMQYSPGYLMDSRQYQEGLEAMHLPSNASLLTGDAFGMYSKIDLDLGMKAVTKWLEEESKIQQHRINLTISLLTLVM